jgi:uncharacterized protein
MWGWDEGKRRKTLAERGIDFAVIQDMDLAKAQIEPDDRQDYGERRFRAFGLISGRLHVAVFTLRGGLFRLISLRRANERETRRWLARRS